MHEHIYEDWSNALGREPYRIETRAVLEQILGRMKKAEDVGVGTIVDCGFELSGPSPMLLLALAASSPLNIVCSTGCFTADMMPPPEWVYPPASPQSVAERFIAAARHGTDGSGVRAGIIKVATGGSGISEIEDLVLRAAVIAQRETGLAITTHTHFTRLPDRQVDIFEDAGADLDRVVIGHMGWGSTVDDFPMYEGLLKRGVNLGLDVIGTPACSDDDYVRIILDLLEAGYASNIVLSQDTPGYERGIGDLFEPAYLTGNWTVISLSIVPKLLAKGVDEDVIDGILRRNPQRILAIDPARYPNADASE